MAKPAWRVLLACRWCTCAEGEELAQETQQVEGHEAFREGSPRKQNLQQHHTQPAKKLLHHKQTHNKHSRSFQSHKNTQLDPCCCVVVSRVWYTLYRRSACWSRSVCCWSLSWISLFCSSRVLSFILQSNCTVEHFRLH